MKRLKRTEPRTEPWSTLLFTGFHLDLLPLTTTLWVQLFSQFSTHFAVFIQPILQQLIFVNSVEDFRPSWSPVKQYPLLFCQTAHFIVEAYQAGQTWFHLDEFVLTTSDDFLLHVPEMVSRESFSSPSQGSKWGWLACSSLIVLFPWDMGVVFSFFQSLSASLGRWDQAEITGHGLTMKSASLLICVHPISVYGFMNIWCPGVPLLEEDQVREYLPSFSLSLWHLGPMNP